MKEGQSAEANAISKKLSQIIIVVASLNLQMFEFFSIDNIDWCYDKFYPTFLKRIMKPLPNDR